MHPNKAVIFNDERAGPRMDINGWTSEVEGGSRSERTCWSSQGRDPAWATSRGSPPTWAGPGPAIAGPGSISSAEGAGNSELEPCSQLPRRGLPATAPLPALTPPPLAHDARSRSVED